MAEKREIRDERVEGSRATVFLRGGASFTVEGKIVVSTFKGASDSKESVAVFGGERPRVVYLDHDEIAAVLFHDAEPSD